MGRFEITWIDRKDEPRFPPDPNFPHGVDLDVSIGVPVSCKVDLPYPAKRCGTYVVRCQSCSYSAMVTTAGRPDDPRSVRLPCKVSANRPAHA